MEICFSIIIPHKNIPLLLQRCLDSIPIREDVQVIVVDDNSDSGIVDFAAFPTWGGAHYVSVFSKKDITAGGARNKALEFAVGKWLLFLDADDFFTVGAIDILKKHKDDEADYLLFGIERCDCDTLEKVNDPWYMPRLIDRNLLPIEKALELTTPCAKMIKRELVKSGKIQFDEIRHHNDTLFCARVALAARIIEVHDDEILYIWSIRKGSLTNSPSFLEVDLHFRTDCDKFFLAKAESLQQYLGNYQIEHLHKFRKLPLGKQIIPIWKMFASGMLFNKSRFEPITNTTILNELRVTLWKGIKNSVKCILGIYCFR